MKTLILEKSKITGGRCKTFDFPGGWKVDSGTHAIDDGEYSACAKLLEKVGKKIPWTRNIEGGMFYTEGKWKPMMEYLALTGEDEKQMAQFEEWMKNISDEELNRLDKMSLSQLIEEKSLSPRIAEFVKNSRHGSNHSHRCQYNFGRGNSSPPMVKHSCTAPRMPSLLVRFVCPWAALPQ